MSVFREVREEAIALEKFRVHSAYAISRLQRQYAEALKLSVTEDVMGSMIYHLNLEIWGRRVGDRIARYPADWWEALKGRWSPRWALERWPVKWTEILVEARDLFPQVSAPPGSQRQIIYRTKD